MGGEKAQKGLTWRIFLALLFMLIIVQPAVTYNWLVNGLLGLALTSWAVILLWAGLARMIGAPLNPKEIYVIRIFEYLGLIGGWGTMGGLTYYFVYLLRNQYFANSEIAKNFGLQHLVPTFFSPIGGDALRSLSYRTFFDQAWLLPILVNVAIPIILSSVANLSLGLLSYRIYAEEEKLEFPIASWDALTMRAIGEMDLGKMRIFILAILAGVMYGSFTMGLTSILGVALFPRVLMDFTHRVESILPGASFSFETNMITYLYGFLLPLRVTALQFIASVGVYVFGNAYVTLGNLWPSESLWVPGQGVLWLYSKSTVYFWNSFTIGWGVMAALLPLVIHYKTIFKALTRVTSSLSHKGSKLASGKYLLLLYFAAAASSIFSMHLLVPEFPLWILLLFTIGISFIMTLLQTHSAAVSVGFNVPYLRESLVYFSGYRGLDVWFVPQGIFLFLGGSNISQQLKMASVVDLDLREYTKVYFLITFLGILGSFVFTSIFWSASPMPGWTYPYTISGWPVEAFNFWRWQSWLWTGYLFRREWMMTGAAMSAAVYLTSDLLFHFPSVPVIMMLGMLQLPYVTLAQFIGSLVSMTIGKYVGREFWDKHKGFIFIGILIGDGLVTLIIQMSALIGRAMWLKPY